MHRSCVKNFDSCGVQKKKQEQKSNRQHEQNNNYPTQHVSLPFEQGLESLDEGLIRVRALILVKIAEMVTDNDIVRESIEKAHQRVSFRVGAIWTLHVQIGGLFGVLHERDALVSTEAKGRHFKCLDASRTGQCKFLRLFSPRNDVPCQVRQRLG